MKSYLVTGGTGFIGAALVKRLLKEGHSVKVLDNNSRGALRRLVDVEKDYEMVTGDIRDVNAVTDAAKGCDCIVHLAAVNGTEFFYSKPALVLDVAVRGMLAVVDAARANEIGHVVVASSSEVYQTPPSVPTDELVPISIPDITNPRYSYGGGKIATELMAMNYGREGFNQMTIFRPHNVYGVDMGWEHVIPQFSLRAKDEVSKNSSGSVSFQIQGDGTQTRAFVHIDDFIDGLRVIMDKGEHLGIYHIGNPEEVTMAELARQVIACFGREATLVPGEAPSGATPRRSPNIGRINALGYTPKISLAKGLPDIVTWYAENAHRKPSTT